MAPFFPEAAPDDRTENAILERGQMKNCRALGRELGLNGYGNGVYRIDTYMKYEG